MKRVVLAAGLLALVEVLLLWRLVQRTSFVFAAAYLLLAAVAGAAVIRHTARQVLVRSPFAAPGKPISAADRLWILLAAVLLIVPGIVTDLVGLTLLMPSGRAVARRWFVPRLRSWFSSLPIRWGSAGLADPAHAGAATAVDQHTIDVTSKPVAPRKRVRTGKK